MLFDYFLTYVIKICYLVISFTFDILRRITSFSERHSVFVVVANK